VEISLAEQDEPKFDFPTPETQLNISIKEDDKEESCNYSLSDESKKKPKEGI
jgi:hypothetical protein